MKVKVGDTVKILAGKDKGKEGKVIKTFKKDNRVVVEGINIVKRNVKPRSNEDKGGIIEIEAPIHVSNVKVITDAKVKTAKVKEVKKETKEVEKKAPAKKATTTKKETTKKAPAKKTASKKETK